MIFSLFLVLTIVLSDQFIKDLILRNVAYNNDIVLLKGFLSITYVENRGAAFGIFKNCNYLFALLTLVMLIFYVYILFLKKIKNKLFILAVTFIVGGGIGNFIDRLRYGFVIDYIKLSFFPPVCNLADYFISIGATILAIYFLFYFEKERKFQGE